MIVAWLVVTPYVLDRLGGERFGVWSLLFLLSGYLATFDLGLAPSVVKYTAELNARGASRDLRTLLGQVQLLYLGLGVAWVLLVIATRSAWLAWFHVSPAHRTEVEFAFVAGTVTFALANAVSVGTGVLTGIQRLDVVNGILVLASIPQLAVLILGLRAGFGLYATVASTAVYWIVTAAATAAALGRFAPSLRWPLLPAGRPEASWLRFGATLQASNLIVLSQQQMDKLALALMAGLAAVTDFELGFRVANAAQSLPVLTLAPLLPALSSLYTSGDAARFAHLTRRGTELAAGVGMALGACTIPVAPWIVRAWVGPGHPAAEAIACGLLLAFAVNLSTGVATTAARAAGAPRLEIGPGLLGLAAHAVATVLLLRTVGPHAVGYAAAIGFTVWTLAFLTVFARWQKTPALRAIRDAFVRPLAASVPAFLAASLVVLALRDVAGESRGGLLAASAVAGGAGAIVFALAWWVLRGPLPLGALREAARGNVVTSEDRA